MNVLVTGGTGFIGSHVTRRLSSGGHAVRLLVRDTDSARALYSGLPGRMPELVQGDVTETVACREALAGMQAVVHAAAATPLGARSRDALFAVNVRGVKNVVAAALDRGVRHIVCLSSITAIFRTVGSEVTADAPPVPSKLPYGQSKVEADLYLRDLQSSGAPIAIVYPGGVIGPDDPGLSDTCRALRHRIEHGFRIFGDEGIQHVDVRDLAALVASLATEGGAGRFLLPGVYQRWSELADLVEELSGCHLRRIPARGWQLRLLGRGMDLLRRFRTVNSPISAETMRYATQWPEMANPPELGVRGLCLREPRETFADTLAWMVGAGHLDPARCPGTRQWPTPSRGGEAT